ncbi:hypothetical protein ATANTOWER_006670 [Ataeniobius toweri]|uniref:Uncharacterized protein n=1 Tax=Ataeniobius toweri TaxID=208326 RepID=A0ABU7BD41_9TELE|nr:hypothetical protein [Ataeniobius toweri]
MCTRKQDKGILKQSYIRCLEDIDKALTIWSPDQIYPRYESIQLSINLLRHSMTGASLAMTFCGLLSLLVEGAGTVRWTTVKSADFSIIMQCITCQNITFIY